MVRLGTTLEIYRLLDGKPFFVSGPEEGKPQVGS